MSSCVKVFKQLVKAWDEILRHVFKKESLTMVKMVIAIIAATTKYANPVVLIWYCTVGGNLFIKLYLHVG
jgi:hypothetical protein